MKRGNLVKVFIFLFLFPLFSYAQNNFQIEKKKEHYGIRDGKKWRVRPKYDQIIQVSVECYILQKDDHYGLYYHDPIERYDFYGNDVYKLIRPIYTGLNKPVNGVFSMSDETGLFALYDAQGKRASDFVFKEIKHHPTHTFCKNRMDQWALYSGSLYYSYFLADSIFPLDNSTLAFIGRQQDGGYNSMAVVYKNGKVISNLDYNPDFGKKKTWIQRGKTFAIADENAYFSEIWYIGLETLPNGNYLVQTSSKEYGILNADMDPVLPTMYSDFKVLPNGNYLLRKTGGGFGIFTSELDTIIQPIFHKIVFQGKYILGKQHYYNGDDFYLFNEKGEPLLQDYDLIEEIAPGRYLCQKSDEISYNRTVIKKPKFTIYQCNKGFTDMDLEVKPKLKEGFYRIDKSTTYYYMNKEMTKRSKEFPVGYIQRTGYRKGSWLTVLFKAITVIPLVVDLITGSNPSGAGSYSYEEKVYGEDFQNGLAKITQKNEKGIIKFGLIDTSLKVIIPGTYANFTVYDEFIFAQKTDKWGLVDRQGHVLTNFIYEDYYEPYEGFIIFYTGSYYHLFTSKGEKTKVPAFTSYEYNYNGELVITTKESKKYTVTNDGEFIPLER